MVVHLVCDASIQEDNFRPPTKTSSQWLYPELL